MIFELSRPRPVWMASNLAGLVCITGNMFLVFGLEYLALTALLLVLLIIFEC